MALGSLRSHHDFNRVLRRGRRASDALLSLYVAGRLEPGPSRLGLVVPGKVGKAVRRNRVRRRLRAIWAHVRDEVGGSVDCVVVAGPGAADAAFHDLTDSIRGMLRDLGVIEHEGPTSESG